MNLQRGSIRIVIVILFLLPLALFTLAGCSNEESPTAADTSLPPIADSEGELEAIHNRPEDFPPEAFRTEFRSAAPVTGSSILRDRTSGTLFTSDGWPLSGELANEGVRLPQLASMSAFWFAWSIFYPGSEIWGVDINVRDAEIRADDDCLVPCGQIRRVLPRDAIPSLPNTGPPRGGPRFTQGEAPSYLSPDDLVIGIFDGVEARAYPHNLLWWHEIVNDTFGGQPLSVSFCPLTGSALVFSAASSAHGVSGNLYNSNLVLYDHATGSLFSQLRRQAITGARKGEMLAEIPFVETTWARWQQMHPGTKVLTNETGFSRDYTRYPYGGYRTDDNDTFAITDPRPDPLFPGKAAVTGVQVGSTIRAFVHSEVARQMSARAVFRDELEGMPVWVFFELEARALHIFHAGDPEYELDLEWVLAP